VWIRLSVYLRDNWFSKAAQNRTGSDRGRCLHLNLHLLQTVSKG